MFEEKLEEAIVGELPHQADNNPQALHVERSSDLVVKGRIDLDALVMVIAGSVAPVRQRGAARPRRNVRIRNRSGCRACPVRR
jgi:hypothetical protein